MAKYPLLILSKNIYIFGSRPRPVMFVANVFFWDTVVILLNSYYDMQSTKKEECSNKLGAINIEAINIDLLKTINDLMINLKSRKS